MNLKKLISRKIFKIVSESANELRYDTYVVGGYVRDILLKRKTKNIDIDFVCVGDGVKLAETVSKKLKSSSFKVFNNFGTAHINHNKNNYEFVGARKESYRKWS